MSFVFFLNLALSVRIFVCYTIKQQYGMLSSHVWYGICVCCQTVTNGNHHIYFAKQQPRMNCYGR